MAYKSTGTAGKSASGASMSKYDVEVEARLKKLEAAVVKLEAIAHEKCESTGSGDVSVVIDALKKEFPAKFGDKF